MGRPVRLLRSAHAHAAWPGHWPAFWLSSLKPQSDPSPGIEIDVVEYYGHATDAYSSSLHVWYKGADKAKSTHLVHHTPVRRDR